MSTIRRGYATGRSGQIHYAEAGHGPTLVLLHSAPRSSRSFRYLLPLLAPHFRAIAPDLPGFGHSDPLPGEVTMEGLAGAMIELLDALGLRSAHVFGYHTGNKVAAAMAAEHPGRVGSVILCGQIHSIIPGMEERNAAIRHIVDRYFVDYPSSPTGEQHLRRWLADWNDVTGYALPRSLFANRKLSAADIADIRVRVLDHVESLSAIAPTYGANFVFDFGAALRRIVARTLVLELVMPDEEHYGRQLDAVCALIPGSSGATLDNAGREVLESHTQEVAGHIVGFLKEAST